MKKLHIYTVSFPFTIAQENSFIQNEIEKLIPLFDEIEVFPSNLGNEMQVLNHKIKINTDFSLNFGNKKKSKSIAFLFNKNILSLFSFEIINKPSIIIKPQLMKQLISELLETALVYNWFKKNFNYSNNDNILAYTYWFTNITTALSLLKKSNSNLKIITRVHGIDLFEDQKNYHPFRLKSIENLDKIVSVSEAALNYLQNSYKAYSNKFKLYRLGVVNYNKLNPANTSGDFEIVSCSSLLPVKRIELLSESISEFALMNPSLTIKWNHFGDGIHRKYIENTILKKLPNLIIKVHGYVSNDYVLEFYKQNPVDVFITTSLSEGGCPVSIQEAFSFGIPAIGTNVGGIPELINSETGILLEEFPSKYEVAEKLNWFVSNKEKVKILKQNCRKKFELEFNQENNFVNFSKFIKEI